MNNTLGGIDLLVLDYAVREYDRDGNNSKVDAAEVATALGLALATARTVVNKLHRAGWLTGWANAAGTVYLDRRPSTPRQMVGAA